MINPTILTGLRANNDLTIGNYFGAILPMIKMAKVKSVDYKINMFIPDLHSITTPIEYSELYDRTIDNAKIYVASGLPLDNENIFLYRQSYIPAHSEMTWILDCFTGFGEMGRMTQFKEKSVTVGAERTSVGLFNYPILMAADILIYNASYVPIGDDQTQHLEFTRDIAERMNKKFGDVFVIPKPVKEQNEFFGRREGLRIKDLVNPDKKMSKSDETGKGVIFLKDDPEVAYKKIMSATTDSVGEVHFDRSNQPGISNLLEILALLRDQKNEEVIQEFEGETRYGEFKKVVASEIRQFLIDFQNKFNNVDEKILIDKLESSEQMVSTVANDTLYRVQQAIGLRPKGN